MANPYFIDFSAPTNALARYAQQGMQQRSMDQQQGQFEQSNALARARMAQSDQHFNASNALAQRTADRADALAPGQLELQRAQIAQARAQGASAAQLAPLLMEEKRIALELLKAKAAGKDSETMMLREIFGGGQPSAPAAQPPPSQPQPGYAPNVQPQSFNQPPNILSSPGVQPVADTGGDPNLVLTQAAPPVVQPQAQPSARDIIKNMDPARRAQFGMAWMGKGEAAKVLGDAAGADKLEKVARNKIDEQEVNAVNAVGRLKQIMSGYKEEHLSFEGKLKQYGVSWLDSFDTLRKKLKPEDLQKYNEFVAFQRDAYENLTMGIKEATGAAMGVQEEARIRKGLPDPEKDNPNAFRTKAAATLRSLETSIQRTQFLRQHGFKGDANAAAARMPIERFDNLLKDSRGLYQKLKAENPTADDGAIRDSVRRTIVRKYGIAA